MTRGSPAPPKNKQPTKKKNEANRNHHDEKTHGIPKHQACRTGTPARKAAAGPPCSSNDYDQVSPTPRIPPKLAWGGNPTMIVL